MQLEQCLYSFVLSNFNLQDPQVINSFSISEAIDPFFDCAKYKEKQNKSEVGSTKSETGRKEPRAKEVARRERKVLNTDKRVETESVLSVSHFSHK
jgi:hypothetical protein